MPVGKTLDGDTLWMVAEHGRRAGYVRNIEANPQSARAHRPALAYGHGAAFCRTTTGASVSGGCRTGSTRRWSAPWAPSTSRCG